MVESVVEFLLGALAVYAVVGLLASVFLHTVGLRRVDPAVAGAGWWFRALVTPGLVALWPWMLDRWRRSSAAPAPGAVHTPLSAGAIRRLHRILAILLALLLPPLVALAVALRPGEVEPDPAPRALPAAGSDRADG